MNICFAVPPALNGNFGRLVRCLTLLAFVAATPAAFFAQESQELQQAQPAQSQVMTTAHPKISNTELDSVVTPIALYPDSLLAQTLAASTYPLEMVQLKQWLDQHKDLKDKSLAHAVTQQNWDPSVQGLAAFPRVVDQLANNVQWTTDLGNAFLGQEADVMDAIQRIRARAQGAGKLKTDDKATVETQTTDDGKQAIAIHPARTDVVYVPVYRSEIVDEESPYAYDYWPYYLDSVGGSYWWGWYDWPHHRCWVYYDNYYNRHWHEHHRDRDGDWHRGGKTTWHHDPQHRGGAPYNRASASHIQKQLASRQTGGRGAGGGAGIHQSERATGVRPDAGRIGAGPRGSTARNQIGNRMAPSRPAYGPRGGGFAAGNGNFSRASSFRGGGSMGGGGFHGGGFGGFHGGMGGGFHGGGGRGR